MVKKTLNYIILFLTLLYLHFNYYLLFFQNECEKEVTQVTWDGGSNNCDSIRVKLLE